MTTGFIASRRFDGLFFFAATPIAVAVGIAIMMWPPLLVPTLWLWLWLLDGPHLLATWQRTYFDSGEWAARRWLLVGSLALLLPGFLAFALSKAIESPLPFQAFLGLAGLAAWHHTVRQHYGIMAVYEAIARTPPALWRFDKYMVHGILWASFAASLVGLPAHRAVVGLPMVLPSIGNVAVVVAVIAIALALALFAASLPWRAARGIPTRPATFALVGVFALVAFMFVAVGLREPLLPQASNAEQLVLGITVVGGIVHAMQYLGIVFATNRRRHSAGTPGSLGQRLGRSPWLSYVVLVTASLVYVALNAARGSLPELAWLTDGSDGASLFLALYWGLFFHHYYLDQKIWRVRDDPRLRAELGLQ